MKSVCLVRLLVVLRRKLSSSSSSGWVSVRRGGGTSTEGEAGGIAGWADRVEQALAGEEGGFRGVVRGGVSVDGLPLSVLIVPSKLSVKSREARARRSAVVGEGVGVPG